MTLRRWVSTRLGHSRPSVDERGELNELGFHGDAYLLRLVHPLLSWAEAFIETGTNVGSTLRYVASQHPHLRCYSCEPDESAAAAASRHTSTFGHVTVFNEGSRAFLARLADELPDLERRRCVFWLDAHGHGFEWPLRDELRAISHRFEQAFVFVDDFKVPGAPEFGFDVYQDQECSLDYVRPALSPSRSFGLHYPAYREHTSTFHPLRGWALFTFGVDLAEHVDALTLAATATPDVSA